MATDILSNVWPEWKIEGRPLGRGSYGTVYKAIRRDHNVESYAAIKVISIPSDQSEVDSLRSEGLDVNATRTYLQRVVNDFVSEIQLMESFKGVQNIVSVEDYKVVEKKDEIGWDIYIRMELLTPLNSYICDKTLSEAEVIKLGVDICTALELCAKRNVIHRDIKPENIFINQFGDFKLGDFGIARKLGNMTSGLSQKGTPNYMAPEVEKGTQYNATVDLYSLGLVLYRFTNKNRLPFLDTEHQLLNPNERIAAIRRRMDGEPLPAPCAASPALAQVILCACAHDPKRRFSSASAMKAALLHTANGTNAEANDLDKTASVRHAQQAIDLNRTTSVRKAPKAQKPAQKQVDTFGRRKKSKVPAVIVSILIVALLAGAGVFVLPKLLSKNSSSGTTSTYNSDRLETRESNSSDVSEDSTNGVYSNYDEEKIAAAIEDAEELAANEDYEGALTKIKTALVTYPKAGALQAKEIEYTEALSVQIKAETLAEAAGYADSGDYAAAITLMKSVQGSYGEDADFATAYNAYLSTYKAETIKEADKLAADGNHLGAIQKIAEATAIIGKDSELAAKSEGYEDAYVSDVINQVDSLIKAHDYSTADNALSAAHEVFPNNQKLIAEKDILANSKPKYILNVCPPYQTAGYYTERSYSMAGSAYVNGFHLNDDYGGIAYFNLGGQFDCLSFDVGHIDGKQLKTGYYYFYIDGVLAHTLTLDPSMLVEHVEIPLNGAQQLVLQGGSWCHCYALVNVMVSGTGTNSQAFQPSGLAENAEYLLTVCPPYQTEGYYTEKTYSLAGSSYNNGFHLNDNYGGIAYFNLGGQYDTLSFDVGHKDGDQMKTGYYYFYLDGTLVYTLTLDPSMLVQHVEIPLNGATQMVIEGGYWCHCFALVNVAIS